MAGIPARKEKGICRPTEEESDSAGAVEIELTAITPAETSTASLSQKKLQERTHRAHPELGTDQVPRSSTAEIAETNPRWILGRGSGRQLRRILAHKAAN
jgi:hypothetical protein